MPEQISQSARQRLSEFSRRIAVSRQLDQVIGAELCSHMEDKLLAYLDGRD